MKEALSHLLNDLLSAILFLAVYLTTANITAAAAVAITVGLAQIAAQRFTGRRIWPMQWISLLVVIVLSAASIATQSPRFVMLKPSLGHFAIAAAMLKRGWMSRYLPEPAQRYLPDNAPVVAGYAWAGLMAVLGLANILIALYAPFAIWVWFISVGAIGAKVAAFMLQYAVFRTMIRRARRRAEGAAIGAVAPHRPRCSAVRRQLGPGGHNHEPRSLPARMGASHCEPDRPCRRHAGSSATERHSGP